LLNTFIPIFIYFIAKQVVAIVDNYSLFFGILKVIKTEVITIKFKIFYNSLYISKLADYKC